MWTTDLSENMMFLMTLIALNVISTQPHESKKVLEKSLNYILLNFSFI